MIANEFINNLSYAIEYAQDRSKRYYLGGSAIGDECERKLQYEFRHCTDKYFTASTLKKFDDGHRSEAIYIDRIKSAGYQLQHEENGIQYGFSDFGGWFRGHRDGKLFNLPFLNNQDAIWEHKSSAKWKTLDNLVKKDESTALKSWNLTYYIQAQLYMGYDNTHKHLLTCSSEGSRDETVVVTDFNQMDFDQTRDKANRIITSDGLLPKISNNPTFFKCKMCDSSKICHGDELPRPNCRNCSSIDFLTDGDRKAKCAKFGHEFEGDPKSLEGSYDCHTYLPELIDEKAIIDGLVSFHRDGLKYTLEQGSFVNGSSGSAIKSIDLYEG